MLLATIHIKVLLQLIQTYIVKHLVISQEMSAILSSYFFITLLSPSVPDGGSSLEQALLGLISCYT